ncbi:MAG: hypothetical protein AAF533_25495 [Acidobacteriota bacterium]
MSTETKGHHRVAWRRDDAVVHAEVNVEVAIGDGVAWSVVGLEVVPAPWRSGVQFGVELLRGALGSPDDVGVVVRVLDFRGLLGDTTETAAACATFHAVAQALGADAGEFFELDETTGEFRIGQGRPPRWVRSGRDVTTS